MCSIFYMVWLKHIARLPTVILYYAENVLIAQTRTRTRIPTPYFCTGQEYESMPIFESGNVFKPLPP